MSSNPSLRDRHESTSVCLPDVAIYNAGHRKSECITAR
ncbi:transcriptional antitermination N peptide [Pantoea agglomerans]